MRAPNRLTSALATAAMVIGGGALAVQAAPAAAQMFSTSYQFLEAVRERDGNRVSEILNQPGNPIVNTRDVTTGRTALHIVVERRDLAWVNFLLQRGADPRIGDRAGITPLRLAADIGFVDGARALIARGAGVDQTNARGETALHIAVQRRDLPMVRMLIEAGANPDLPDSVAGKSARDYATEDRRGSAILTALTARRTPAPPAPTIAGPN
jgi:uncharacterized protein